jgi:hypothetical protein
MRKLPYTISNFVCLECGTTMPLPRIHGSQRKKGHIKMLECPVCKKQQPFREFSYKSHYKTLSGEIIG